MPPEFTSDQLLVRLRERYPAGEWAFFGELRGGTGFTRDRRADAIAMNLWPSRGLGLHGFEIKVSRSDWRRELENPAKAEELQAFCNHWWIVTASEQLVQLGEMPPTWGWMVPWRDGFKVLKDAPALSPKPLDRPFIAAMVRRLADASPTQTLIKGAVEKALREREHFEDGSRKRETEKLREAISELQSQIAKFENASGIKLDRWNSGRVGEALQLFMQANDARKNLRAQLEYVSKRARDLSDQAVAALEQFPAETPAEVQRAR